MHGCYFLNKKIFQQNLKLLFKKNKVGYLHNE